MLAGSPEAAARFRFTTAGAFNQFVLRCAGTTLVDDGANALRRGRPELSAASPYALGSATLLAPTALAVAAAIWLAPDLAANVTAILLSAVFIAWLALRITGALIRRLPALVADERDATLPIYTVICALYQEASSVPDLLSAIERLDYPREKLNVILAVEADDTETRQAISAHARAPAITLIAVPPTGPRTKPKALNVALPFARGAFTVVYDAEDRPDADQLRRAVQAFRNGGDDLACVQARLCIDNTADSAIASYYTAEYAAQFDVFLPGLTAMRLPLPLGGSSNHFRTDVLRDVGGWDAYNVTEDADLGMRLSRFGYRADMIESTTYEEAPSAAGPWLRQRTRWFKGWMQTWLVHMRRPGRLLTELGLPGFLAFQLMVGGNALAALVHPLFLAALVYACLSGDQILLSESAAAAALGALYSTTAIIGYLSSAFLGFAGLKRRGLARASWVLMLTPLHWLMLSLAAWRALYQLFFAPYRWEKTTHGLARTSHRAERMTRALLDLERELDAMTASGDLPAIGVRDTSSIRRQRLPASASS